MVGINGAAVTAREIRHRPLPSSIWCIIIHYGPEVGSWRLIKLIFLALAGNQCKNIGKVQSDNVRHAK